MTRQQRDLGMLAVMPLVALVGLAIYQNHLLVLDHDSPDYMYFSRERPIGYPLFLGLVRMVFGSFAAAPYIQLGVLCFALGAVGWSVWRHTGSIWWGLALELLLFLHPMLLVSGQIASDSLSISSIAFFTAIVVIIAGDERPPRWAAWALIGVTAVSITIRPVNVALVPAAIIALLVSKACVRSSRRVQFLGLALGLTVAQAAGPVVHWLRNDPPYPPSRSGPLARGLLVKTLFREWPLDAEADRCDGGLISKVTQPVNAYLALVPSDIKPYLILSYDYLRFGVILPELADAHPNTSVDPIIMCYAFRRIRSDPLFFIGDAVAQFWNLLTYYTFVSVDTHDKVDRYLKAHPPVTLPHLPFPERDRLWDKAVHELRLDPAAFDLHEVQIKAPNARPQLLAVAMRVTQVAAAAVMIVGILVLSVGYVRRRPVNSQMLVIGILGVAFYGEMVIMATLELAIPRYTYPLWPLCGGAIIAALLWSRKMFLENGLISGMRAGQSENVQIREG